MKRFGKVARAAGWFALAAAGHAYAAGMDSMDTNPVHAWHAVSEDKLDDMRGGFDVPALAGLHISFGIDRAVYVNGDLVASASVTVSYTHLTLPTNTVTCRSRWSPYH